MKCTTTSNTHNRHRYILTGRALHACAYMSWLTLDVHAFCSTGLGLYMHIDYVVPGTDIPQDEHWSIDTGNEAQNKGTTSLGTLVSDRWRRALSCNDIYRIVLSV